MILLNIKRIQLIGFIVFGCVMSQIAETNGLIEDVIDIFKLGIEVSKGVFEAWDVAQQTHLVDEVEFPFRKVKQKMILSRLSAISRQIELVESQVNTP